MVIAIIAIISTLAVSKLGGVREMAARKVSLANQKAVERSVEAYLANGGRLNRLDSLLYAGSGGNPLSGGTEHDFDFNTVSTAEGRNGLYLGPSADADANVREQYNCGLTAELQKILCLYTLDKAQADAFATRLGLRHVMAATAYADAEATAFPGQHYSKDRAYGDGTVPNASDGLDPNDSFCVATLVTNSMRFAAINPMTDLGRTIYQACGQELMNTKNWNESYTEAEVRAEVAASGGPLIALGLGASASIIGKSDAGLEDAPYSTYVLKKYYSRYILLFRLKTIGSGSVSQVIPEFAGVIDCEGNTLRAAMHVVKRM
jgi:hypothetical protein